MSGSNCQSSLPVGCVQRDDPQSTGGEIHHAVDDDRRALNRLAITVSQFARTIRPSRDELVDVVSIDLVELGVAHAAGVIANPWPVDILRRLRDGCRGYGECREQCKPRMTIPGSLHRSVSMGLLSITSVDDDNRG